MTSTPLPSRRAVLAAGLLAPLAGCTRSPSQPPQPAAQDPDVVLRRAAVAREHALLTAYDRALAAAPDSAALLRSLRAEHAEHLAALGVAEPSSPAQPSGPAQLSSPAQPSGPPRAVRGGTAGAAASSRQDLLAAERRTSALHARDALAGSRALAAVLACLAASEASHVVALE